MAAMSMVDRHRLAAAASRTPELSVPRVDQSFASYRTRLDLGMRNCHNVLSPSFPFLTDGSKGRRSGRISQELGRALLVERLHETYEEVYKPWLTAGPAFGGMPCSESEDSGKRQQQVVNKPTFG